MSKSPNGIALPSNWQQGFVKGRFRIACGGLEIPVFHQVYGWTLLVYDIKSGKHLVYCYKSDTFLND